MYVHEHTSISPIFSIDKMITHHPVIENNVLKAAEPAYKGIPPGILRRMGTAVRMGVGAAAHLVSQTHHIDGILVGTANGGMEDCIKFLNQIIEYDEGMLTPGNFVQSTPNAIAAQIGLMSKNKSYNVTHVHGGLAFEHALIDAEMILKEDKNANLLVGAVDEISSYNYNIDNLAGWYKKEPITDNNFYTDSAGSLAGEGAAMFIINNNPEKAVLKIKAVHTVHTDDLDILSQHIAHFLQKHTPRTDLLISGYNGDINVKKDYELVAKQINADNVAWYKHLTGEHPSATAIALWLAAHQNMNGLHFAEKQTSPNKNIIIYNRYKSVMHSLIAVEIL